MIGLPSGGPAIRNIYIDGRHHRFVNYRMTQNHKLKLADEYCIQVLAINDVTQDHLSQKFFHIEDICKGSFLLYSNAEFELEDRVLVLLYFPDGHSQEVSGRICYCDIINDDETVYGFSVINGFYSPFT